MSICLFECTVIQVDIHVWVCALLGTSQAKVRSLPLLPSTLFLCEGKIRWLCFGKNFWLACGRDSSLYISPTLVLEAMEHHTHFSHRCFRSEHSFSRLLRNCLTGPAPSPYTSAFNGKAMLFGGIIENELPEWHNQA